MEKLFYEDQYQKSFTANILNVIEKEGKFHIELDTTCFYPEGGGQPSDTGFIEDIKITYVYEEDNHIYHVADKKPNKKNKVKCSIDWNRRFDHMQQHLGQHILSASFVELFGAPTVGFHLGKNHCTIDIQKFVDKSQIEKVEKFANDIILKNISLEFLYPTRSELKKMNIRKMPSNVDGQIRIVKIDDLDVNACCGIHPSSTIEVQVIKITKWEKYKDCTRIEFLCGDRAVKDYFNKSEFTSTVCSSLTCDTEAALIQIEKLTKELKKTLSENNKLKSEIADYEIEGMLRNCEDSNGIKIIKKVYHDESVKTVNLIGSKLTSFENVVALLGVKTDDKSNLLFMKSKNIKNSNMNELLKDAITLIDGKGGGNEFSAQGGGKQGNNIESALDYAYMKVLNS
ncbi:alanyl-tRNA editing protein [Tepidibacter mesophilus]|uniref:alanyl-tRNA editing protein n=1 Tax=Tepidibacter mesophilus TaxID=655607 RepID=UPI000C08347D|nr:DHHA1 domain-containing protein [Tepidibacter mesophilus]